MWKIKMLSKLINDCLTENDGVSYCPVRVIGMGFGLLLVIMFVAGWVFLVYKTRTFDPTLFVATGASLMTVLVTAIAGSVSLKALTDKPLPTTGALNASSS
jgi:hypothetical protein